jgi:hypothetical protein
VGGNAPKKKLAKSLEWLNLFQNRGFLMQFLTILSQFSLKLGG